ADDKGDGIIIGQAAQKAEEFDSEIPVQSDGFKLVQQQDQFHASAAQSGHQFTYVLIGGLTFGDHEILVGQRDLLDERTKEIGDIPRHFFLQVQMDKDEFIGAAQKRGSPAQQSSQQGGFAHSPFPNDRDRLRLPRLDAAENSRQLAPTAEEVAVL